MKYKACCKARCLSLWCDIRDEGGCDCICKLVDQENSVLAQLDGSRIKEGNSIIYVAGRKAAPGQIEKANLLRELEEVRANLKKYER